MSEGATASSNNTWECVVTAPPARVDRCRIARAPQEYHPVMNPYGARPEVRTAAGKFAGAPATPPLSPAVQVTAATSTETAEALSVSHETCASLRDALSDGR